MLGFGFTIKERRKNRIKRCLNFFNFVNSLQNNLDFMVVHVDSLLIISDLLLF